MVKIVEFFDQKVDDELSFNVVEDLSIYMRNNPMFYRKYYYPSVLKLKEHFEKQKQISPNNLFLPVIEKAVDKYCREFNLGKRPNNLLNDQEKKDLIQKIYEEEMANIKEGKYE